MNIACVACETSLSPDYPLLTFIQDINELTFYIAPLVMCVVLWKLFVTNRITPGGNIIVLRLDAGVSTCSPTPNDR